MDFEIAPKGAKVVSTARAFNLVGLRWHGETTPDVELRVRRSGRWSRWAHVGAHATGSSDPLWVGRAKTVQYKLSRRVRGLRLHFVAVGKRRPAPVRARSAQALPFSYVPRETWEQGKCSPRSAPDYGTVRSVHVHHTVSLNDYTPEEAPSVVLAICRYHRNSNGWNDVGYNMLVDKYGVLYEGRAGGVDQAVVGAQAQGFNAQTAGIANIGDHTAVAQTPEALAAMANWIRWKLTIHGQPLSGPVTLTSAGGSASKYGAGARVTLERVIGHRDTGRTACPGDALYGQLPELRALVATGVAPPAVSSATRLDASLSDDSVAYGETVPVGGSLVSLAGAPLAGEIVEVQVSTDGTWRTAKRVATGADGAFSTELKPRQRMYLRVRYAGRSGLRRSTSPRLLLRLGPAIAFSSPPSRAVRGKAVSLKGTVGPRKRLLRLVVQESVRGRWRKIGAKNMRVRRGRFTTSFTPGHNGLYRFYAVALPDLDTDRGASLRHTLRVR